VPRAKPELMIGRHPRSINQAHALNAMILERKPHREASFPMFLYLVARPFIRLARCHIIGRHKPDSKRIWDGFTFRTTCTLCHRGIFRRAHGNWRLSSSAPGQVADIVTESVAPTSHAPPLPRPHDMSEAGLHEAARLIVEAILILDELAPTEEFASLAAIHAQVSLDVLIQEGARIANAHSQGHAPESWRTRLHDSMGVIVRDQPVVVQPPA